MKRKRPGRAQKHSNKRQRHDDGSVQRPSFPLLKKYYREVVTLRQYLASRLSKKRRKRLQQYGRADAEELVSQLLDTTLVGTSKHVQIEDSSFVEEHLTIFTQQLTHSESSSALTPGEFKQSEVGSSCHGPFPTPLHAFLFANRQS